MKNLNYNEVKELGGDLYSTVAYCIDDTSQYIDCYNIPDCPDCDFYLYEKGELPEIEEIFEDYCEDGELGKYQILNIVFEDGSEDYIYIDRN